MQNIVATVGENKIEVSGGHFSAKDTICCGQVFRFKKLKENTYRIISMDKAATLCECGDKVVIETSYPSYFYNYFDLDFDYNDVMKKLSQFSELSKAIEFGKGLRILKQNLTESIISFIISANNNIPRIQGIIEKMCARAGEQIDEAEFAFPTIKALAELSEEDFRLFGAGFRAPYLVESIKKLNETDFLAKLMETKNTISDNYARCDSLLKQLLTLKGVGQKVADCVLLFGLKESSSFPTDTWVFQAAKNETLNTPEKVRKFYSEKYGDLSGYAQQYLFYYQRSNK